MLVDRVTLDQLKLKVVNLILKTSEWEMQLLQVWIVDLTEVVMPIARQFLRTVPHTDPNALLLLTIAKITTWDLENE